MERMEELIVKNEVAEVRGIGTGNSYDRDTSRRTAFTRGFNPDKHRAINGVGGRIVTETKANGTVSAGSSNEGINRLSVSGEGESSRNTDTDGTNAQSNTGDSGRNASLETGSSGIGGSPETRRRGNPGGPRGKYNKSNTDIEHGTTRSIALLQEEHSVESSNGVEITVENSAIDPVEQTDVKEKKARVKKPKEPPAGKVGEVSASLKDVYQIIDMVTETAIKFLGKGDLYPKDLMCLDDDVANRLARSLVQLNDAMPKLAAKFNTVSTPAMLISTLATDLFGKGVMLYGIIQSPKISQ